MVQMYGVVPPRVWWSIFLGPNQISLFWSHDFNFLHNPIVYGVTHLLYGVALSDSVQELSISIDPHPEPVKNLFPCLAHLKMF